MVLSLRTGLTIGFVRNNPFEKKIEIFVESTS